MKRRNVWLLIAILAFSCKNEHAEIAAPAAQAGRVASLAVATDSAATTAAAAPAMPRMIIRNAQMALVVGDAAAMAARLGALASSAGGYVSDAKQWREQEQVRATLTLRVPAQRLDETLAAARKLAVRVESETVDSNDVSQEYVDLESQVRNLEAAENEMRQLMGDVRQRMQKAEDILEIYRHLTELRGQIEQAKGRMRAISQLTALATIKLELIPDAVAKPVVTPGWQPVAVARDAGRKLVGTLQGLATIVIWCAIYLLPIAALFAVAVLIARAVFLAVLRRRASS